MLSEGPEATQRKADLLTFKARFERLSGERCHEETEREGEDAHGTQGEEAHAPPRVKRAALHRALLSANPGPWKPNAGVKLRRVATSA
jgi:hypothetical protein